MFWYKLWYFDKKQSLKAYDLLLFPEKRLTLILGAVHKSHAGLVLCHLQKQFSKVLQFFSRTTTYSANIIIVVSYGLVVIQLQCNGNKQNKYKLGTI